MRGNCWSCSQPGHPYWKCTEVTGQPLAEELRAKVEAKAKAESKGKGGGKVKGKKGDAAQTAPDGIATPPGNGDTAHRGGGRRRR